MGYLRGICPELLISARGGTPQGGDSFSVGDTLSIEEHLLNFASVSEDESMAYANGCLSCCL